MVGPIKPTKYVYDEQGRIKDRASPELLSPALRKLPGELVTKELEDPDKAHPSDAPHVIGQLIEDHIERETKPDTPPPNRQASRFAMAGERVRLSQREIDFVRMRVISVLIEAYLVWLNGRDTHDSPVAVHYLWFPEDNVNHYELRDGNPPSDADRPKHLRGFRLECDIEEIPRAVHDLIKEAESVEKELQQ